MIDANELMRRLLMQSGGQEAVAKLQRTLQAGAGQELAKNVDSATASRIERAAQAAQAGDKNAVQAVLREIMSTPEGAALAAQLGRILGK
ncbi:MAG: hypothetical protein J6L72_08465 [Butyricicoccus sp.]|nr:hypothetical protein [Butyricicoccus sp.]